MTTTSTAALPRFYDQADKTAELARLDDLIGFWARRTTVQSSLTAHYRKSIKIAKARRRKISGLVVGA